MKKPASLADKIMDGWYAVAMFPAWATEKNPRKAVRVAGLVLSFPVFAVFLPITAVTLVVAQIIAVYEDI